MNGVPLQTYVFPLIMLAVVGFMYFRGMKLRAKTLQDNPQYGLGALAQRWQLQMVEGDPTYTILQPLFQQECGTCHGTNPSKGLRLTDYESALAGSVNGPVFVAGDPEGSKMIQVFEEGHFAELTEHQLDLIRTWITNGMPQ